MERLRCDESPILSTSDGGKSLDNSIVVPARNLHVNCSSLSFNWLCQRLERVQSESNKSKKVGYIFNEELASILKGQSVYPLMRLVLPENDKARPVYGIKESTLSQLYVKALNLSPTSTDGDAIINWKVTKETSKEQDLSEIIYKALVIRINPESKHSIGEVNSFLDELYELKKTEYRGSLSNEARAKKLHGGDSLSIFRERVVKTFTPIEQKWLIKILLGTKDGLKIGMSINNILNMYNETAMQKYNECSDLRRACEDPVIGTLEVGVPCAPMLLKLIPATKDSAMIPACENAMRTGTGASTVVQPFIMDIKYDGERVLYHQVGNGPHSIRKSFSRNTRESSSLYHVVFSDVEKALVGVDVDSGIQISSIILDGELVVWDKVLDRPVPFGNSVQMAKLEKTDWEKWDRSSRLERAPANSEDEEEVPIGQTEPGLEAPSTTSAVQLDISTHCLKYVVFDCLVIHGKGLDALFRECASLVELKYGIAVPPSTALKPGQITHFPLALRREILMRIIRPQIMRVEIVEFENVLDSNVQNRINLISRYFEREVIQYSEEGVVVKNMASTYILGEASRKSKRPGWVKIKPDYNDQTEDLDLLIVGSYLGEGRGFRGAGITSFLLAARADLLPNETEESFAANPRFIPITKVGTGLPFEILGNLRQRFNAVQTIYRRERNRTWPKWLVGVPGVNPELKGDEIPDYIIHYNHSLVVTIRCSQIVNTEYFPAHITCRFPRIRDWNGIRYEKGILDVMTVRQLIEIQAKGYMSVAASAVQREKRSTEMDAGASAKKKKTEVSSKVDSVFKPVLLKADDRRQTRIFEGMQFFVSDTFPAGSTHGGIDISRRNVEMLIQLHSGKVVGTVTTMKDCIILVGPGKIPFALKNLRDIDGALNMVDVSWLVECTRNEKCVERKPFYHVWISPATRDYFHVQGYNLLGYGGNDLTMYELKELLSRMDLSNINSFIGPDESSDNGNVSGTKRKEASGKLSKKVTVEEVELAHKQNARAAEARLRGIDRNKTRALIRSKVRDILALPCITNNSFHGVGAARSGWRALAATLLSDERVVVENPNCFMFQPGNIIYLDIYETLGQVLIDAPPEDRKYLHARLISPRLLGLKSILVLFGAVVTSTLNVAVTHVILDPRDSSPEAMSRRTAMIERRVAMRGMSGYLCEKHWVSADWAEDCIERKTYIYPRNSYKVDLFAFGPREICSGVPCDESTIDHVVTHKRALI